MTLRAFKIAKIVKVSPISTKVTPKEAARRARHFGVPHLVPKVKLTEEK